MQVGINLDALCKWAHLGVRAGNLDPRGAYFSQADVVAALDTFVELPENKQIVEKDAFERALSQTPCRGDWVKKEAYAFRTMCSHWRIKCKEWKESKGAAKTHTAELKLVYASFTDYPPAPPAPPALPAPPPIRDPRNSDSQPFHFLHGGRKQPEIANEILAGVAVDTPIEDISDGVVQSLVAALGLEEPEPEEMPEQAEEEEAAEEAPEEPQEIVASFDWVGMQATMLMSDGPPVAASSYAPGPEGVVVATFPTGTQSELEVPNVRLKADGTFMPAPTAGKGQAIVKRQAKGKAKPKGKAKAAAAKKKAAAKKAPAKKNVLKRPSDSVMGK